MKKLFLYLIISITAISACSDSDKHKNDKTKLMIFHAGSLSVPFKQIADSFMHENPEIKVLLEAGGSLANARKIIDLDRSCDIFASADYLVVDEYLIPKYAKWNLPFVTNEMVIAFTEKSKFATEIDSSNWFRYLQKPEVKYGRSDPNSDPCGYRTVLVQQLADHYYRDKISVNLLGKDNSFIRPKEVDLLSLLETNTLDFIFIYRSVAIQHKLKYVTLPDEINLKSAKYADYYKIVKVNVRGEKPGTSKMIYGEPMIYSVCIPTGAQNPEGARKFMEFLFDNNKGMRILKNNGQETVVPASTKSYSQLPDYFKIFAKP